MQFNNLKIGMRLGVTFALITVLIVILALTAFKALADVSNKWQNFASVSLEKREYATQGQVKLGDAIHHFKNFVLRSGDYNKKFEEDIAGINAAVASYKKNGSMSARETALLAEVLKGAEAYRAAIRKATR